jgi:DNA replication and repair protein RecF
MRQRNRLLSADEQPDPNWLTALEEQMAFHGSAIAQARSRLITLLSEQIAATPDGPFAKAVLALEARHDDRGLIEQLASGRARDAAAGRTLAGPHRADLIVTHLAKQQPAANCSTGEQKALLLGIILAHAELVAEQSGQRPILLLDEVAAHLDHIRRAALFARLASGGGQVWMTGTDPELFSTIGLGARRFCVENAKIAAD